jgi:TetR/AcrR family transcriptional repressor of nem operon
MAGRPKIFDPREVLYKARNVFWEKGYEAASTTDLCDAMGIGKGSFYQEFEGGKQEVFEKTIDLFSEIVRKRLETRLVGSKNPLKEIKNIFREIALAPFDDHVKGCFVGNTLVEMSGNNHHLEDRAIALLKGMETLFYTALKQAQENGQLDRTEDPGVLAKCLLTLWNGINLTRRMYPDQKILVSIIEKQLQVLP